MVCFKVELLVIVIVYGKSFFFLGPTVNADLQTAEDTSVSHTKTCQDESLIEIKCSEEMKTKIKKTRGTYKKRKTTTFTSIRNVDSYITHIDSSTVSHKKYVTQMSSLESSNINSERDNQVSSRLSSTIQSLTSYKGFKTSIRFIHTRKINSTFDKNSKKIQLQKHITTSKKFLDRRRHLIIGGKEHKPGQPKRFTPKFVFKNCTPKYSPIHFQTLFQQVFDLRKMQSNTRMARPTFTIKTTPSRYQAKLNNLIAEYDGLIKEERKYNESREEFVKKEMEEIKQREASMQKSYVFQFVVTKVTTESWEKDLSKSSRAIDEEFYDPYAARLNQDPAIRKSFDVRKSIIQGKIKQARHVLAQYHNGTLTKHSTKRKDHSSDEHDDENGSYQSGESVEKKRYGDKGKGPGRHIIHHQAKGASTHQPKGHLTKSNAKRATFFQPNDNYRQMQEGWSRRNLNRMDDTMDIYEPDPSHSEEIERMKSYDITSNEQFIQYLKDNQFTQDKRVLEAIHWVDRDRFAKDGYVDGPHNFGTNSIVERPSYQALCLNHLADNLVPGAKVLDLGFGSGFMSCCMARMVGDSGHVTAIEHLQHLVNLLLTKLKISYPKFYKLYKIMDIVDWDARIPYKKNGPYDVIHFGGGVNHIPLKFIHDLKINGTILVPVGPPCGPHILKKITLIKENVYTVQDLAEVEALHFCGPDEQVHEFRQTYGHHFIKLFSLFYKTARPFNSTVTGQLHTYKLLD